MKRKIITTSTSCLSYIKHNLEIEIIPDIIKMSDNEIYNDSIDYAPDMLFNRLEYDRYASPRIYPQKVFYIKEFILRLMDEGYDSFIFILPSSEILDYKTNINIALAKIECEYEIFDSRLIGYPVAYLAMEAARLLGNDINNEEILMSLKLIDSKMSLILLQYKEDLNLPLRCRVNELDIGELDKKGRIYKMENGRLISLKHDKGKSIAVNFLEAFLNEIKDKKTMPFIMSSVSSQYKMVIENRVLQMYNGLKAVEGYQLPSVLAGKLGYNIIALGYINKD